MRKISYGLLTMMKRTTEHDRCKVCGDDAIYSYFGVIACEACKMFFKRHAETKKKVFECFFDNRCEINLSTRQNCSACRLKKCFQSGMQIGMIRHGCNRKSRKEKCQTNVTSPALLPTTNLLRADTSSLSKDQWTLLTNLTYLYDQARIFNLAQRLGPSSLLVNRTILKELLNAFYEESGDACRRNADFQVLTLSDRSVLLPTAIDNITCLGGIYICVQTQLAHHQGFMSCVDDMYGKLTAMYHRWATTFVKCDDIFFKLALALFALSTNSRTFQQHLNEEYVDVKSILDIESRYAELLWKYLLYRYSFKEAVERYVQLIRWFLAMSVFMYYAHHSTLHVNDIQSLTEDVELNLILDDVDETIADAKEML